MSICYIIDTEGRTVSVVLDIEGYEALLKAQREFSEATVQLYHVVWGIAHMASEHELAEYRRSVNKVADAQRILNQAVESLESLDGQEDLEDLKSVQAYDVSVNELERGEGDLLPWEQAKREIEEERAKLRSQGEL
jgi:exonuclease VII small subunit